MTVGGGDDGRAVATCAGEHCQAPKLTFVWDGALPERKSRRSSWITGVSAVDGAFSWPRCERGAWRPTSGGVVAVAAEGAYAVFGAAGCVEVSLLTDLMAWRPVASLPQTLDISTSSGFAAGGVYRTFSSPEAAAPTPAAQQLLPSAFGTQVALAEGLLAVTAAVNAPSPAWGSAGKGAVPVVVIFLAIGPDTWVQADAIECAAPECLCAPASAPCPGGFGAALAVFGDLLAVGFPANTSVALFRQTHEPRAGGAWHLETVLEGAGGSGFGAALSLGPHLLLVGRPLAASSGAQAFSVLRPDAAGLSAMAIGTMVFDTVAVCCSRSLPCCATSGIGGAVAQVTQGFTVRVMVGDSAHEQTMLVDCSVDALLDGGRSGTACRLVSELRADSLEGSGGGPSRFGTSVAAASKTLVVGGAGAGCRDAGAAARGCGAVCTQPTCPPGFCLLYDLTTVHYLCLGCGEVETCPGGTEVCAIEQAGLLVMAVTGAFLVLLLCCCLCSLNVRLIALNAGTAEEAWETLFAVCCCLPLRRDRAGSADGAMRDERLLDEEESGGGCAPGEGEGSESGSDDGACAPRGYIPPAVQEALGLVGRKAQVPLTVRDGGGEGSGGAGAEVQNESGAAGGRAGAGDVEMGREHGKGAQSAAELASEGSDAEFKAGGDEPGAAGRGGSEAGEAEDDEGDEAEEGGAEEGGGGSSAARRDDDEDEDKVDLELDFFLCKTCQSSVIDTVLVPCGHKIACRRCARRFAECPVCATPPTRVQPIFHV